MAKSDIVRKLNTLAEMAEDLAAEFHDSAPDHAAVFAKVARHARRVATCMRLHGQAPEMGPGRPILEAARQVDKLARSFSSISNQLNKVRL